MTGLASSGVGLILAAATAAGPQIGLGPAEERFFDSRDRVAVTVIPDRTEVAPGDQVRIAVILDHDEGWHVHTNDPVVPPELGDPSFYFATVIEVDLPPGSPLTVNTDLTQWPPVHETEVAFLDEPVLYGVFSGRAIAYVPAVVAPDAPLGRVTLRVKVAFQACDDRTCLGPTPYPPREPGEQPDERWLDYGWEVALDIVPPSEAQSRGTIDRAIFGGFDESVWARVAAGTKYANVDFFGWFPVRLDIASFWGVVALVLLAAVGGFILNLTPCVLPVIPIKIMSLSRTAGNRRRTLVLGSVMSLGIIAFWMGLAVPIVAVTSFTATNQLLQYPLFTIGVGVVIALLAVGMCGVFSLRLPHAVYQLSPSLESIPGSFGFGVMVAVLSTPCTAPVMGAALAGATQVSAAIVLIGFAAVGAGMALPYQFLSMFPHLVDRMPRSGPASELIKHVMGLLMLSAAAYFAGSGVSALLRTPPDPPSRVYLWFVGGFGVLAGAWLLVRTFAITPSPVRRGFFGAIGAVVVLLSGYVAVVATRSGPIDWVYFTPQRFEDALADGDVVVLEFTAEWCINCKALEQTVLSRPEVVALLNGPGVVPIKVDITGNWPPAQEMLERVDRLTIPLLVVFDARGNEVFKADFYTARQVIEAVEAATERRSSVAAYGDISGTRARNRSRSRSESCLSGSSTKFRSDSRA